MDVSDMRTSYNERCSIFLEENLEIKEPFYLFDKWYKFVTKDPRTTKANAMCLATASKEGVPSARFVLMKGYSKEGFIFFTHYTSRKGQELVENPHVAVTFYWEHCNRSVRVEGKVERLPFCDADSYFKTRPYESQIGSLCSDQSKPIPNRTVLTHKQSDLRRMYSEGEVPRPPLWGGYIIKPHMIEFWQGHTDKIHDRIRFRKASGKEPDGILTHTAEDGWVYERLCP